MDPRASTPPRPPASTGGAGTPERSSGDISRNLSFVSGHHVITVQSLKCPATSPRSPASPARGSPRGGDGGALGADAAQPLLSSDELEAALLPPEESEAAEAERRRLRRRVASAQGLSWGACARRWPRPGGALSCGAVAPRLMPGVCTWQQATRPVGRLPCRRHLGRGMRRAWSARPLRHWPRAPWPPTSRQHRPAGGQALGL
jgi:hypothetical protein